MKPCACTKVAARCADAVLVRRPCEVIASQLELMPLSVVLRQDVVFGDVTSKEVLAYFTMHGASMSWEDKVWPLTQCLRADHPDPTQSFPRPLQGAL